MEISEGQFTTLPNKLAECCDLGVDEVIVYLMCKKNMNNQTRESRRSMDTLASECSLNKRTVKSCLQKLEDKKYLEIRRSNIKNSCFSYYFPPEKEEQFEMIALAFLENEILSPKEKGLLSILQKDFKIDKTQRTGSVFLERNKILEQTGMSSASLSRIEKELSGKQVMHRLQTSAIDEIAKVRRNARLADIDKTKQSETILAENIDAMKLFMGAMFKEVISQMQVLNNKIDDVAKQANLKTIPKEFEF